MTSMVATRRSSGPTYVGKMVSLLSPETSVWMDNTNPKLYIPYLISIAQGRESMSDLFDGRIGSESDG